MSKLILFCPGCGRDHQLHIYPARDPNTGASWRWNGSLGAPTIDPSIHERIEYTDPARSTHICHSFVENGEMRFLADCTHDLAKKTVRVTAKLIDTIIN